jgi:KUP system potassium uptake protein
MSLSASRPAERRQGLPRLGLLIAVLGVVYGDIGTSPLYTLQTGFGFLQPHHVGPEEVLGILSLVVWTLFLVVTVKYVLLVMRADNRGEGGILALMALAQRVSRFESTRRGLAIIGIIGASLFFGDGVITPAISVLSAVEGLEVSTPGLDSYVLLIAVVVIVALFLIQSRGTERVGHFFGPIMAVWFVVIGICGLREIAANPSVILAFSPLYALRFCLAYRGLAFVILGAVVLAVTGAEALYADMGHFGARPIRISWLFYVFPCLIANYLGQGALILEDPSAIANPFYLLVPAPFRLPMVILATIATVIASQALISGAFSMGRQCMQLGFLPRLTVRHTGETEEGQIYIPQINYFLAVAVIILVLSFKTSASLASAYGIAVTGTFLCTAILAMVVFRRAFHWPRLLAGSVFGFFMLLDGTFFAANSLKIAEGGWVPILIAVVLMALMTTWRRGRDLMFAKWQQDSLPLATFLARLPQSHTIRVPGIAVFLTGNPDYVPGALLHNLKHNKVLHEVVLFVTVVNLDEPEVRPEERVSVETLGQGCYRIIIRYGFKESPNIPRELERLKAQGVPFDPMQVSYFLGRETLVPALVPKMSRWRMWLFLAMARNAISATEFFRIPPDRVVELGVRVAI